MRATLGLVVVALVTVVGVLALANATQYKGGKGSGGFTRVRFEVDVKHYHHDLEDAAESLWYSCIGVAGWEQATAPRYVAGHSYEATVRPRLAEDASRRFRGCMQDGTIDKVQGHVEEMTVR